jgi:biopolymer transport protein ExbB/TolQ
VRISRLILFLTDELLVLFVLVANGVQMVQHVFFSLCTSSFFLSEGCNKLRERKDKEKEAEKEKERERETKREREREREGKEKETERRRQREGERRKRKRKRRRQRLDPLGKA